jgi:alkanesulfonate monooxygenase SsuD/methylene tetrahydromethanopterin reductase-like flavin-dependent oxidoreductase (luciferase family)
MTLATTIALAVVRGPFALAKSLGAIDLLSGGRLIVGVGPGSYPPDYEAEGLVVGPALAAVRWRPSRRFERSGAPRATRSRERSTRRAASASSPRRHGRRTADLGRELGIGRRAPPGRSARRRMDRLRLQHQPRGFVGSWARLREQLPLHGKDPETFPNALATMMFRVEDDPVRARRVLDEWVARRSGGRPRRSVTGCSSGRRGVCGAALELRRGGRPARLPVAGRRADRAARALRRARSSAPMIGGMAERNGPTELGSER